MGITQDNVMTRTMTPRNQDIAEDEKWQHNTHMMAYTRQETLAAEQLFANTATYYQVTANKSRLMPIKGNRITTVEQLPFQEV